MRISDWSSDVCSSDLRCRRQRRGRLQPGLQPAVRVHLVRHLPAAAAGQPPRPGDHRRREEVRRIIAVTRLTADRKEFRVQSPKPMSCRPWFAAILVRSEEHTSELQSLMRNSYAVFCLKKKNKISRNRQ